MSEAIKCITCGAVSYNDFGKTSLHCNMCFQKLVSENERLYKEVEGAKIIIKKYLRNNRSGRTPVEYIEALNWERTTK